MLKLEGIYYRYWLENSYLFSDLNLSLPPHKKIALLGNNGVGKSTLLLLIDGLLKVEKGNIYWENKLLQYDQKSLNLWRKNIGITFQNPEQQLVAGTVEEDISYGLCNLQLSEDIIKQRLKQILLDFNLENIANKPLHHLSLGQKRRVALAGVMALKPQLLLLDEPTTFLDNYQQQSFLVELEKIYLNNTTILIATHDLNFAYQWANWFIILGQGKVILEGDANTVFNQQEILTNLQLETPLLWQLFQSLPNKIKSNYSQISPKTIAEFKQLLASLSLF